MKKLLILTLCLVMWVSPLVSCGGGDDTTAPETTAGGDTTQGSLNIPNASVVCEERTITADSLGYRAVLASSSDPRVADARVGSDGSITLVSYVAGSTTVTVKNCYGEKLEIAASVAANGSFTSVAFEKFKMPEHYVYATDFGVSPLNSDNTPYFQAAIDSLTSGGTVYVPKGIYKLGTSIVLKADVTIRLEGIYDNYNTEFNAQMASDVKNGRIAVLSAGSTDMFINHVREDNGRNGVDNIGVVGGALDMNGTRRCFVWCCAEGVLLENVILKDCPNNHAIQVTGSTDVVIRDCLFAGYNDGQYLTRETIQIEASTPGAIGGTTSPFDTQEFYTSENIVIEGCYFGKSDEFGTHHIPIGHHGHSAYSPAKSLDIKNCTFVNPLITAIRAFAYSDLEISGNTFISNEGVAVNGNGRYMIELTFKSGDVNTSGGACFARGYERTACNGVTISDNVFRIGASSLMGGIVTTNGTYPASSTTYAYDARAEKDLTVVQFYSDKPYSFTGYKMVSNRVSDLLICDNDIVVENTAATSMFYLANVKGLEIRNNSISAKASLVSAQLGGSSIYGAYLSGCTSADEAARRFVISALSSNTTAPIVLGGGSSAINAYCNASSTTTYYELTLSATVGGSIERRADADGKLYITPVAAEGYVFDGYYSGGVKLTSSSFRFASSGELEVRFVAK